MYKSNLYLKGKIAMIQEERLELARKFCYEVKELAKKYNLPVFVVTDGASATHNNNCEAVRNARASTRIQISVRRRNRPLIHRTFRQ